jgi:hypothetical protein
MRSKRAEPLDFERDLPTSPEDVAALKRIRESRRLEFRDYLVWLSRTPWPEGTARRRKIGRGVEPFEL